MNKTDTFRALHSQHTPLILPNVWDAGGARMVESLGAKAVATTSAGVAWSKGFKDGNVIPTRLVAHLAEEIVNAVKIPVSIDFEAGYSDNASVVAENLRPIAAAGISGINIEDGIDEPKILAKKIEAIKKMASLEGVDIFVNARTDVYLQDLVADDKKVNETLTRAGEYERAGADGLFVPGLTDIAAITTITNGTGLPINLMSDSALPKASELAKINVRRLSAGIALATIVYKHLTKLAAGFLKEGDCRVFDEDAMSFSEFQSLFPAKTSAHLPLHA